MNQRDHQQRSQSDEHGNLTIGLDAADDVLTGLIDGVSTASQTEVVGHGSTGHHAEDSEYLPDYLPDRFESGTPNLPGIYGWEAALQYVESVGIEALRSHEMALCQRFLEGLSSIEGIALCGTEDLNRRVGVVSVDFLLFPFP